MAGNFKGYRGRGAANKYNAVKVKMMLADGTEHTFDSKKEAQRYKELELLVRAGKIADLRLQKSYELVPKGRRDDGKLERAIVYKADFVYKKVMPVDIEFTKFNVHLKPDFVPVSEYKKYGYPVNAVLPGEIGACGNVHYGQINSRWSAWKLKETVEDVKGYRDPASAAYRVFVMKRKLMLHKHGISVVEV